VDGIWVIGSSVGGVAEEEVALDLFFLRSACGLEMKFSSKEKPVMHYPIFTHNRRKHERLACIDNSYHTCILS
jgi:hypothetical protein